MAEQRTAEVSASDLIDAIIAALGDWRGETLARIRRLIHAADPGVVEAREHGQCGALTVRSAGANSATIMGRNPFGCASLATHRAPKRCSD
ncbi:MAG: hypothetical protein ABR588_00710 [Sphingomicrobium sp.]|nr:hypothetical protein [Sphingomonadales bacterium]